MSSNITFFLKLKKKKLIITYTHFYVEDMSELGDCSKDLKKTPGISFLNGNFKK